MDNNQTYSLYSKETEEAVLSAVLIFPEEAIEYPIEPDDFYLHRNRWIWEAFTEIVSCNETPNPTSIIDTLNRKNQLEEVGGAAGITRLLSSFVTTQGIGQNVAALKDYHSRRLLVEQANWMAKQAFDLSSDLGKVQDKIISMMAGLQTNNHRSRHISEVIDLVYEQVQEAANNPREVWGISTGFLDIDRVTGGLHPGETIYLAGEPKVGKSILANQIGLNASAAVPVWLVSLEMKETRLVKRILSAVGEVETRNLSTGILDEEDWNKLIKACDYVMKQPIYIWDKRGMTLAQFRAEAARLKKQYGIGVIVLDYLYLLAGYDDLDLTPRTETLSNGVQEIAGNLDIAIICVNSVTKEGMKGYGPRSADIRGSGQLVHNADIVAFINKVKTDLNPKKGEQEQMDYAVKNQLRLREITFTDFRDNDLGADSVSISLGLTSGFPKFVDLTARVNLEDAIPVSDPKRAQITMERFHE